jgi:hypothetical protein
VLAGYQSYVDRARGSRCSRATIPASIYNTTTFWKLLMIVVGNAARSGGSRSRRGCASASSDEADDRSASTRGR